MSQVPPTTGAAPVARVALAAGLVFTIVVGGSESGALITEVRAIGAIIGALLVATYIIRAPGDHDRVDLLTLAAFLVFLLACALSSIPRISFESATTAFAYVAAFYVARREVMDHRGREFAVSVLGMVGAAIAVLLLVLWGSVWWQWLLVPDAGPPPFNLLLPRPQFAPVRASILVALLLPAMVVLARRPVLWPLGVIGTASALVVIVISGSRTTWLAGGVALVVVAMLSWQSLRRTPRPLIVGIVVVAAAGLIAVLPQLASRVGTSSTVELRFAMWSDAIGQWLSSPLAGTGPGTFATTFMLSGHHSRWETYVPHAHNTPVQTLLESGLIGLIVIGLLGTVLLTGKRQLGRLGLSAVAGLTVFAVASLTEDPTQGAFLIVPLIVWSAVLLPATPGGARLAPTPRLRAINLLLAAAPAVAMAATLVAAAAHDRAAAAANDGDDDAVIQELKTAVRFDPSFPLYHRELGVWLLAADSTEALRELESAVSLNPGDQAALRALAIARAENGDAGGALLAARAAFNRARLHAENAITLAYVGIVIGDEAAAREGMVGVTRFVPWVLAAPEWDVVFPEISKSDVIRESWASWTDSPEASVRNARARAWLAGLTGQAAPPDADEAARAEAALLGCQPSDVANILGGLSSVQATTGDALQARLMYARSFEGVVDPTIQALMGLRNTSLARQAFGGVTGDSPFRHYAADVQVYRRIPLAPPGPTFPTGPSGLSAWLQDPIAAADLGAPGSPLATCR